MKAILSVLLVTGISAAANAQVPILNSYPSAPSTIFLDFDGEYVNGTPWNSHGPIDAQPSGLSSAAITEIFNRVAEDYRIFDVNVTTDSTVYEAAPLKQRTRIIITPSWEWYGAAGGISLVGTFKVGSEIPGWVFCSLLGNNPKYVAEAASHEAGHTLGLQHQSLFDSSCAKTAEYSPGKGSGEIGWAPIMGVGYYQNLTTWYVGPNTFGCNSIQDDISIIASGANGFGLRSDDYGNSPATASPMQVSGIDLSANGMINTGTDDDVFSFDVSAPSAFLLTAIPQNVGSNNSGANLDIKVSLLNAAYDTLGSYNPSNLLSAGFDTTLSAGRYYLSVQGVTNAYLDEDNSVGYYSLTGSLGLALPVRKFNLSGQVNEGVHHLHWNFQSDEAIKEVELQTSADGEHYDPLVTLPADSKAFSTKPLIKTGVTYFRVRAITVAEERSYYSNVLALRDGEQSGHSAVDVLSNIITQDIRVQADKTCHYQLFDATGKLVQRGLLEKGFNRIPVRTHQKGLLLLRVQDDTQTFTEKLIKQ